MKSWSLSETSRQKTPAPRAGDTHLSAEAFTELAATFCIPKQHRKDAASWEKLELVETVTWTSVSPATGPLLGLRRATMGALYVVKL